MTSLKFTSVEAAAECRGQSAFYLTHVVGVRDVYIITF